jgi:glutaredoxin-like protein NrdH
MMYNTCKMTAKFKRPDKNAVFLFALSTCIWCRKLKALLDQLGVHYEFVYVDQLEGEEKESAVAELLRHNPSKSFPTLLVGRECVVGFQENRIKELLSKCPTK